MSGTVTSLASSFPSSLVLVHGDFGDGFEAWGPLCAEIGRQYRTVTADRPGFGGDLGPRDRFTIAGEASAFFRIAGELGLDSFHLVGHSYGALIALEMALRQPAGIRSLHLIEPPLLDLLPDDPLVRAMGQTVKSIQRAHGNVGDEATTEAFFAMIGAEHVPERLRGTSEWDRLCQYADRFSRTEPVSDYSAGAILHFPKTLPVGIYSGGRSHPALRAVARELAGRLPGARFTAVATAGHAVQMSGSAIVAPLLALVADADAMWEEKILAETTDSARE